MWISLYTFLEMSLFVSATIYDTTQNFFTILTVWTKIVQTASGEDNHCPHCYRCGLYVKNVEKIIVTLWSYGNIRGIYNFWPQWNKSRKRKYLGQIWQIFDQRTNMARISTSKMQFVSDYITFLSTFKRFLTNF